MRWKSRTYARRTSMLSSGLSFAFLNPSSLFLILFIVVLQDPTNAYNKNMMHLLGMLCVSVAGMGNNMYGGVG